MIITTEVIDAGITIESLAKYAIKYDLGTKTTAQAISEAADVLATFDNGEGANIIESISDIAYIYGGGNGGTASAGTRWYVGNMLKLGTGSYNGSLTINLTKSINRVKITGYVHDTKTKIRVGDSASTDWAGVEFDDKTVLQSCADMNIANLANTTDGLTSVLTLDIAPTSSVRIDTAVTTSSKYPFYITGIEFILVTDTTQG